MSEFDNIFKNYLKEMDLTSSAAKAVTSPQFTKTIDDAVGKMGANGAGIKALGAALMGEPHLKDLNETISSVKKNKEDGGEGIVINKTTTALRKSPRYIIYLP